MKEIIAALWAICALLEFGCEFTFWGWIFALKAMDDTFFSIHFTIKESLEKVREKKGGAA